MNSCVRQQSFFGKTGWQVVIMYECQQKRKCFPKEIGTS